MIDYVDNMELGHTHHSFLELELLRCVDIITPDVSKLILFSLFHSSLKIHLDMGVQVDGKSSNQKFYLKFLPPPLAVCLATVVDIAGNKTQWNFH